MKCYVCGAASVKRHDRSNLCPKHHRFLQMQSAAKYGKKYVPSLYEIERLVPKDMVCQDCSKTMHWIDGEQKDCATLQHYRDGTLALVCLTCNVRHGQMPGDSYRDIPKGFKLCTCCKTMKPLSDFGKRSAKEGDYPKSKCKVCDLEAQKKWRAQNPERYKELNKLNNDKKRLDPEKARERDKQYYWAKKLRKQNANITV